MTKSIVEITGFKELQAKIKQLSNPKDKKRELISQLPSLKFKVAIPSVESHAEAIQPVN